MKRFKKLAGLLLALVMVCALGVTAFAADDTYTITITYEASGHTYEAYQIFTGDLNGTYVEYTETAAPTDGTQLYTYDSNTKVYTAATYDATSRETYYSFSGAGDTLSNVEWGSGVNDSALLTALQADTTVVGKDSSSGDDITVASLFISCTTAAEVAKVLSDNNSNTMLAERFAQLASQNLTATMAGTSSGGTTADANGVYTYTISGLKAGYYLVKDQDNSVTAAGDSYTDIILQVVTNVAVEAKADTTTLDKEAGEGITDKTYETTAEYDIGDDVPFTLIATLPSNYASYSTYKMTFHDKLSDGLSFNDDVKVTVYTAQTNLSNFTDETTYYVKGEGGMVEVDKTQTATPITGTTYYTATEVKNGYTVVYGYAEVSISSFESGVKYYTTTDEVTYTEVTDTSGTPDASTTYYVKTEDSCTFEVRIANTNALLDESGSAVTVNSSSLIVVTYTAELLNSAASKETNSAKLEYSNNPNDDGSGTGNTPDDVTTVFTFTLDVNKVASDSNPLEGAGFTLYKLNEADTSNGFVSGVTYYTYNTNASTYTEVTDTSGSPVPGTTYYTYTAVGSEVAAGYQKVDVTSSEFVSGVTYYTYDSAIDVYTEVTDTSGTPASGTDYYVKNYFTFKGLAVGYYKLVETTTPSGYNTMADFYFRVDAKTTETSETGSVESLTVYDEDSKVISGTDNTFTISNDKLTFSTDIENTKGSALPSTGGIGTTIFYVIGAIMVFGAAVVLITRRRMKAE